MKIDSLQQFNNYQNRPIQNSKKNPAQANPNFTGLPIAAAQVLNFLDTSPAWGANFVDFAFMVTPRTLTDFTRGVNAGMETARRESMGTINDSSVGLYGTLAGAALATGVAKAYGFKNKEISSVFADSETIDMMGDIWHKDANMPLQQKIEAALSKYEVFKNDKDGKAGKWVKFKDEDIKKAASILTDELGKSDKLSKEAMNNVKNILTSSNSLENNFRIIAENGAKQHSSRYNVGSIVENTFKLSKLYTIDKVAEAFKAASGVAENKFLKALKGLNMKRSIAGVLIASLVGCSVQPINMWLTKRKTGSDSFVGGGKKDDSAKFKIKKALTATVFGAGVIATIGNPKNLLKNLQFKGFTPTISQLKFIYGATIMSRFMSARNDNELKESATKDVLGFVNWLILGNFVQKLVAQGLDKDLIKQEKKGGILNWITSSSLKTRNEVLHEELKDKAFKDGKALNFKELMKAVNNLEDKGITKAAKKKLGILTLAQLAGYAYSGLVLGIGIPRLNIALTKRRLAKQAANEAKNPQQDAQQTDDKMLSPENREFLKQKNFTGVDLLKPKAEKEQEAAA